MTKEQGMAEVVEVEKVVNIIVGFLQMMQIDARAGSQAMLVLSASAAVEYKLVSRENFVRSAGLAFDESVKERKEAGKA